jgi:site-specific recombinase XerD
MVVQNFAESSIASYLSAIKNLVLFIGKTTNKITSEEIFSFLIYLKEGKSLSRDTIRLHVCAFRHYYKSMENRQDIIEDIPYPKKEKHLPVILSGAEVKLLFECTKNLKHRVILKLAYSAGLRRSEIINLKIADFDTKKMIIRVNQGKGKKDRYTLLAKNTLSELKNYLDYYKPNNWLLNGRTSGSQISKGAIAWIIVNARQRVNINKAFHLHTLRHSFASHLLATGVNLVSIQKLMGHEDIRTTMVYLHTNFDSGKRPDSPIDIIYK